MNLRARNASRTGLAIISCLLVVTTLGESMYLLRPLPGKVLARAATEPGREERESEESADEWIVPALTVRRLREHAPQARTRSGILPARQALLHSSSDGAGRAVSAHARRNGIGAPLRC